MTTDTAWVFPAVERIVQTNDPSDVVPILAEVERLTTAGMWALGLVSYEAAEGLDATLPTHRPPPGIPLVWFAVCGPPAMTPAVARPRPHPPTWRWRPHWSPARYRAAVEAIRTRIAAGDTYQCNLTTRYSAPIAGDPWDLYARLAHGQRGAYHAFLDTGELAIASASPELLFQIRGDTIETRPMKGTARRGRTTAEDAEQVTALTSSAKERAENIMIVDLIRNDLATIATTGTVTVDSLCTPERYDTVHQLTSQVRAHLPPSCTLPDVFAALFPCGSVTGAPKRSAMQILTDLEDEPRGVYCGAIGFVGPPSSAVRAQFSVAIRTVVVDRTRSVATYGTGGAVTWDSDPHGEHTEAVAKTAVLTADTEDFELLETVAHHPTHGWIHLDRHLARLTDSADYFGFPVDLERIRSDAQSAVQQTPLNRTRTLLRIALARDGHTRIAVAAAPPPSNSPITVALDDDPIDTHTCWHHHKTSRRSPYDTRLARHTTDDVLLVNERGHIAGSCSANLVVQLDGHWWTPPLGSGCVPGVTRAALLESGHLTERAISPADIHHAQALALINTVNGWQPAILLTDNRNRRHR